MTIGLLACRHAPSVGEARAIAPDATPPGPLSLDSWRIWRPLPPLETVISPSEARPAAPPLTIHVILQIHEPGLVEHPASKALVEECQRRIVATVMTRAFDKDTTRVAPIAVALEGLLGRWDPVAETPDAPAHLGPAPLALQPFSSSMDSSFRATDYLLAQPGLAGHLFGIEESESVARGKWPWAAVARIHDGLASLPESRGADVAAETEERRRLAAEYALLVQVRKWSRSADALFVAIAAATDEAVMVIGAAHWPDLKAIVGQPSALNVHFARRVRLVRHQCEGTVGRDAISGPSP